MTASTIKPLGLALSFQALCADGRLDDLERIASRLEQQVTGVADWQTLLSAYQAVPLETLFARPALVAACARAHTGARAVTELLEFTDHALERLSGPLAAPVWVQRAWALQRSGRHAESIVLLERALPDLVGSEAGQAWKFLALARARLDLPDWMEAFTHARACLNGRALGLMLIDQSCCLDSNGQSNRASDALLEAITFLEQDAFHLAWARNNLGTISLRQGWHGAERHFLEAHKHSRRAGAQGMASRALAGLGSARRVNGEFDRAISTYQRAIRAALEPEDAQYARRHLGLTYRLAGRPLDALEVLYQALHDQPGLPESDSLLVQLAAVRLTLGDLEVTQDLLGRAEKPDGDEAIRARIYRSELARRMGRPQEALSWLEGFPMDSLAAREEFTFWSDLAKFGKLAGLPVPNSSQSISRNLVRIQALGGVQASVNGQAVKLEGRAAELVVFLLEHSGVAPLETVADAIWPECDRTRGAWNVKRAAKRLRESLGWTSCVSVAKGRVQLDARTVWEYDANEFRAHPSRPVPAFMPGIFSEWALEVAAGLENLLEPRTLN
jgi:tetratricopeptide (TPR) repeat protein